LHSLWKIWSYHGEVSQVAWFPFKPKGKISMVNQVGIQDDSAEKGQSSNTVA